MKDKKNIIIIALVILVLFLSSLVLFGNTSNTDSKQLSQVPNQPYVSILDSLVEAENEENWDSFIANFHSESPARTDNSETVIKELWKNQDTGISVKSWKVVSATNDVVIFQVELKDSSNKDTIGVVSSNIEFRKDNGDWKIWTTSINDVSYE